MSTKSTLTLPRYPVSPKLAGNTAENTKDNDLRACVSRGTSRDAKFYPQNPYLIHARDLNAWIRLYNLICSEPD